MPNILTNLRIREVSSVTEGAGRGVQILMMKSMEEFPEATLYKRQFSADERKTMAEKGQAMPNGSFPIANEADLHDAIRAVGRGKGDPAAIRQHIAARAQSMGLTSALPPDWDQETGAKKSWATVLLGKIKLSIVARKAAFDRIAKGEVITGDETADGGNAPGAADDPLMFNDAQAGAEAGELAAALVREINEACSSLQQSVCSIMSDADAGERDGLLRTTFQQFQEHVGGLTLDGVEKAMAAAGSIAASLALKEGVTAKGGSAMADTNTTTKPGEAPEDKGDEATQKAVAAAVAAAVEPLQKKLDETVAELATTKSALITASLSDVHKVYMDDTEMTAVEKTAFVAKSAVERDAHIAANPIEKKLPASIQKKLGDFEAMQKQLGELTSVAKLEKFQKRATDMGLGDAFGETLMKAYDGDHDAIGKMEQQIKALTVQVKQAGLFTEVGTQQGADTNTAKARVDALIADMQKAAPTLSRASALAKIAENRTHADLWKAYKDEAGNGSKKAA